MSDALVRKWTRLFYESASAVSTADDGSIYILEAIHDGSKWANHLAKYKSDGSKEWSQLLGFSVQSVSAVADGSVYIAGTTTRDVDGQTNNGENDVVLSKYNNDGSREWTRLLGTSTNDSLRAVSAAADGSVYITGCTNGDLGGQTHSGSLDAFLSKYKSDGSEEWTRVLGTSSVDIGKSVSTAPDGSVYIAGVTKGDLDGQKNSGGFDAFLSKYNSDGSKDWTQLLGSPSTEHALSVSTATDGSIYIAGYTDGELDGESNSGKDDAFLSKYNSDGSKVWTQLLGTSAWERADSVSTSADGSVYIVGDTNGELDGQYNRGHDAFLSKYNSDGSKAWTQLFGGSYNDYGRSVSAADDGSIYIVGTTSSDLRGQNISGEGLAFLSKYIYEMTPIALNISATSFNENAFPNSISITLTTSDPNSGDTHSYALVSGVGDTDNSFFTIDGDQLTIIDSPDFESKSSYSIRLETRDSGGLALEKEVTLNVNDVNDVPINLSASSSSFDENISDGAAVATLSTVDQDSGDTHSYALISGDGDTDNSSFTIEGDQLKLMDSPDFESKSSYSIRLQTQDSGGLILEREVTLNVNDINEEPADLSVLTSTIDENISDGAAVATLSTSDPDLEDKHTYALISGDGDTDNSSFTIEGDQLKLMDSPDFESKSSYSIRLQTQDSGGLILEREVTLNVNDINEEPADLSVSTSTIDENISDGAAVATLSTSDPDLEDKHTYALVSGDGDADNSAFTIDGDKLKIIESPDYEVKDSYSIRLRTTDALGLTLEKEVAFDVNGLNELPSNFWISTSKFGESIEGGSAVATLSTEDQDTEDTHSYELVSGFGDADNDHFTIEGDQLKIIESPGLFEKSSYSVRLQTKDSGGLTLEKSFTLSASNAFVTTEWTNVIGLPFLFDERGYYSDEYGFAVSAAADGSVYIAGATDENLDGQTNSGDFDAFLSKYNAEGSRAWTKLIGSSSEDWGYSVATGIDGTVYIAGFTEGNLDGKTNSGSFDAFLSRYNSDGSKVWTQLLGSSSWDYGLSVGTATDGSVYIAGTTTGNLDGQTNSGEADAFLSKFNSDGSKAWTRLLGSSSFEWSSTVATSADGSVYITGDTYGDLGGQTNGGGSDVFLSKFTSDGSKEWTRLLGASSGDYGYSVSTATDGSVYIAGYTEGDLDGQTNGGGDDIFLGKYNSNGSKEWTRLLGSASDDYGYSVSTAADGSVYITGETYGDLDGKSNGGGTDTFLSKYTSDGFKEWTQLIGSFAYEDGSSIDISDDGSIFIGGSMYIPDREGQPNVTGWDAFLGKYGGDEPSFRIKDLEIHSHGLSLQLNDTPDMNVFGLYVGANSDDQDPGLILTNSSNEVVNLTAHWEDDTRQLHLLSNQVLEDGDYTLKIRADGLVSQSGDLLDGNRDGEHGDDYVHSFTHSTPDHFISVGDTARSAGQDLSTNGKDLKDGITGIPIHLSTTSSLQSVSGEISYDSDLLKDVSLAKGSDLPSDWVVNYSESSPGTLAFTISGQTGATGSIEDTLRLMGQVDANASDSYGSTSLIQATITDSSDGQISFKSDPGLMVNAYSGDTTGNGSHSSLDASRVQRVVVGLDSGFDAFDDINPVLIGDTTGNGSLSSLDASRIQQEVVGLPVDTFPEIPIL